MQSAFIYDVDTEYKRNTKKYEQEFDTFLCEAQKWLVLIQAVYYSFTLLVSTAMSFYTDVQLANYTLGFFLNLGLGCPVEECGNVTNTTRILSDIGDRLLVYSSVYGIVNLVQSVCFIVAAIVIRIPRYQKRWTAVSTVLMIFCTLSGPLIFEIFGSLKFIQNDVKFDDPSVVYTKTIFLLTIINMNSQRQAGLFGLQLIAFAPRFVPYAIIIVVVALTELSAELVFQVMFTAKIADGNEYWSQYLINYCTGLYGIVITSNITAYTIPAGMLWCFERMLHSTSQVTEMKCACHPSCVPSAMLSSTYISQLRADSFVLQKTLQLESNHLMKEARPFALSTIKDWIAAIGSSRQRDFEHIAGSSTSSIRLHDVHAQRHPWQLDADDLELGDVIGTGSHGKVYRGRYKGGHVAVKTLIVMQDPADAGDSADMDEIYAETAAEAEALSRLRHENMMHFYGICFLSEQRAIAMVTELCSSDLRLWIDNPTRKDDTVKQSILFQIVQGLVHLHEDARMVHRDLKPSNILLTDKMVVKLCDFGISRVSDNLNSETSEATATRTGTLEYMAPECFNDGIAGRDSGSFGSEGLDSANSKASRSRSRSDGPSLTDDLRALRYDMSVYTVT